MGLATANALAALRNGARQVEATVNGIGERAGNTALEEIAVIAALKGVGDTGIQLDGLVAISAMVAQATGVPVQPNRAIVGRNAFTHSSGIHQDGILKAAENYQFVAPELVGKMGHDFVLTARSGRNAVIHVAKSRGHVVAESDRDRLYTEFVRFADTVHGAVDGSDLDALVARALVGCSEG
jgi:2-isopropylmalate synthase